MGSPQLTELSEAPVAPPPSHEPLDPELRTELLAKVDERGQVTVFCSFLAGFSDAIRIWSSTALVCLHTGHRSALIHAEGIPYAPVWLPVQPGQIVQFTLVFAALPRTCVLFDLYEEITDPGGFHVSAIPRNGMDVYRVEV